MAKDGTNRGGRRVCAGSKPDSLADKISQGKAASIIEPPIVELEAVDLYGADDIVNRLKELTVEEYSETKIDKDDLNPPLLFVFGKDINSKLVYIKLKIKGEQKRRVLCVSFHYAKKKDVFSLCIVELKEAKQWRLACLLKRFIWIVRYVTKRMK